MEKKFNITSLGCAKNLIDSEQMLAALIQDGWIYDEDPEEADILIINTCAFIEDAKKEAIDNILELARLKNTAAPVALIVTGCLAERYKETIFDEMPEVDALLGCGSYGDIVEVCNELLQSADSGTMHKITRLGDIDAPLCERPRLQTTPKYTAYIKIAEGCDNHCAYCVIPSLRGHLRSRKLEDIISEAQGLANDGVKELIVVAQDITSYGVDMYGRRCLDELLNKLCEIEGLEWIRLHYLYPDEFTEELITVLAKQPKIVKYLDIPIQHCNDRLLRNMNRRYTKKDLIALFDTLRQRIPGLVLRTSIIVGLPGETEEDFDELCEFIKSQKITKAGFFTYSQEEGTIAGEMPDQIDEDIKLKRRERLMDIQEAVMEEYNKNLVDKEFTILVEGFDRTAECYYGRSYAESLDIDGKVFFFAPGKHYNEGTMIKVKITDEIDGDPLGEVVE